MWRLWVLIYSFVYEHFSSGQLPQSVLLNKRFTWLVVDGKIINYNNNNNLSVSFNKWIMGMPFCTKYTRGGPANTTSVECNQQFQPQTPPVGVVVPVRGISTYNLEWINSFTFVPNESEESFDHFGRSVGINYKYGVQGK